jgi:hypothetical protein
VARTGAFVAQRRRAVALPDRRAGQAAVEAALPIEKEFQRITRRAIQERPLLARFEVAEDRRRIVEREGSDELLVPCSRRVCSWALNSCWNDTLRRSQPAEESGAMPLANPPPSSKCSDDSSWRTGSVAPV